MSFSLCESAYEGVGGGRSAAAEVGAVSLDSERVVSQASMIYLTHSDETASCLKSC